MNSTMKIRVVKSSMPIYWYSTTIGKEFEVSVKEAPNRTSKGWHILYENGFPTLYAIHVDDFELVNDPNIKCVKFERCGIVYYIENRRLPYMINDSIDRVISERDLLLNCEYALDIIQNCVIKTRSSLVNILDKHLGL